MIKKLSTLFLFAIILLGIFACSTKPVVSEYPPTAVPAEEITKLEADVNSANRNHVDVLSPKDFREAKDSLVNAKKKFLNGKDPKTTLYNVALGRAYLDRANNNADRSRGSVEDVIIARDAALKADAQTYFSKEFINVDKKFAATTAYIEKNKMDFVYAERPKLREQYRDLEQRAIREKYLKESRDIITQAKKEDAEKFAPRTLAIAEKSFNETENYIKLHPRNVRGMRMRAKDTKEAALHAFNINREARNGYKVSFEEMALLIEKERDRVSNNQKKLNNVEDELKLTQSALEKEKETKSSLAATKEELETEKLKLETEKLKLETEKAFNEKYEEARKQFSSNEAEVYRQGDNLLIRLKGIEFPSSAATIDSKKFPLLSKVKNVVEEFGKGSMVLIEGHTDSTGGKTINHRLSTERAKAVKEYLEANQGGLDLKIEAVGYADQKPLSSNKTASGRSQNRRVDIIIKPETTKL